MLLINKGVGPLVRIPAVTVFMPNITTNHAITYTNYLCFVCLKNIKGEIENNIEIKSHLLDLRNHFLNRYMSCVMGKNKFSFFNLLCSIFFASY